MSVEYEIWRISPTSTGKFAMSKFATRKTHREAIALVKRNAAAEPNVQWKVYETISKLIYIGEMVTPRKAKQSVKPKRSSKKR